MIGAFTNGANKVPTGIPTTSAGVKKAKAKVKMTLELSGKVADIYPGQRKAIKAFFAKKCGVGVKDVIVRSTAAPGGGDAVACTFSRACLM